ncbi:MAG: glycosyltransferase family 4 protein [Candidatus Aenigmarchaeota archaeon]|nr:glycosyltransferase family 4 protein [Candidatus Aenigmarchaeota archaeon]
MRILFLSSRLPYPPIGGDRLKNYWLLKILSKHFRVHLVSLTDTDVPEGFYKFAEESGFSYKIFKKYKLLYYWNSVKGIFFKYPLQVNYYYFQDVQNYIKSVIDDFDFIISTLIRTAHYVIDMKKPKILDMADSIGQNYQNSTQETKSLFWKIVYSIEKNRLLNYEKLCIDKFDRTLLFNKYEVDFFSNLHKVFWVPHGVDDGLLCYEKTDPNYKNYIVFFGKMDYQPNIDAVLWFIEKVLPRLDRSLTFCVIGANPPKFLINMERRYRNLKVLGFVEEPYVILKSSLCVVAPMQTGGGIQNKVLQSMALGTINIISSLASKPIGGENWRHYIVSDEPESIAEMIHDILKNPDKYEKIKNEARNFIKNNFTWSIYEREILRHIQEVLNAHKSKSSA